MINRICGWQSGFNNDKVKEAGLDLVEPEIIHTPGIQQYPLTIECRTLNAQRQDLRLIPQDNREKAYPQDVDGIYPMANRDPHTMNVGEIVEPISSGIRRAVHRLEDHSGQCRTT